MTMKPYWRTNMANKKRKGFVRKVDRSMHDYGEIDYDKQVIRVNPRKGDLVNTIVHEELHRKYPDWSERKVKKESKKEEQSLSISQVQRLLKKYQRSRNAK